MNALKTLLADLELREKRGRKDAITLLKGDHRKVELLFSKFEESHRSAEKQQILDLIVKELSVHASVEEDLVYPIIDDEDHEKTNEAIEEHHVVKLVLAELADMSATDENTIAKVQVLCEIVKHHVKEEESDLLRKLKDSGVDLTELGAEILKRKAKLLGGIEKVGDKSGKQIGGAPKKSVKSSTQQRKAS